MHEAICSAFKFKFTPAASSTSALPQLLVIFRLPCFAICAPAPAHTKVEAVEMLNNLLPLPPVPQVSIRFGKSTSTLVDNSLMTRAAPANSSGHSPLTRSAIKIAAIWASVAWPDIMPRNKSRVCSMLKFSLEIIFSRAEEISILFFIP